MGALAGGMVLSNLVAVLTPFASRHLLIPNRLGSARLADRILALQDGRIVEEGSHGELVARNGVYARMAAISAR